MVLSTAQDCSRQIRDFTERGYLVIPSALTAAQIAALNRSIESDIERHGNDWVQFNEALTQTPDILSRTAELDFTIENPVVLDFLRQVIGEDVTFEEFLVMIREPTERPQDFKG